MATLISAVTAKARLRLIETTASFWTDQELTDICIDGIKDLWRDIVDLKQEHYLTIDTTHVTFAPSTTSLTGVPADVHKVYLIEPLDTTANSTNMGLTFRPMDYNHRDFIAARSMDAIDPTNSTIFYAITGQGAPVAAPTVYCAPQVTSTVNISFAYVPTLAAMTSASTVPIPGEADNALVCWTVAWARAKEREDRSPDANWIALFATEKQHLLQSLGLREYQEPAVVDAFFEDYWG